MASYGGHSMPAPGASRHGHGHGHGAGASPYVPAAGSMAAVPAASAAPAGTFTPGTKIQVGSHRVVIQKYLSEGGFAHVYLVKLPQPVSGTDLAVLKRVAVPDKEALRGMRTEVETMKRLKGHRAIVTYIDSHASELRGGGYEVFLLMEYCDGGGLIDFMNTRLQHRLTEPEILNIFTDVAEGVACMHYLKPPLLHRDLKVENVLITTYGAAATRKFKLCDFGSAAPPKPAPTTVVECRLMDEDVQKHTTLQYRSPEMIDVYRKQPIDEKSDIWALGVLLYKLCYYTTPFEDQGQLAILNASFKYPSYPVFSDRLKRLIASMLKESQQARPNIYQVLREGCAMQGREPPIKDIYSGRPRAESGQGASPEKKTSAATVVGASFAPTATKQQQAIPDVVPMRRGRPTSTMATPQQPAPRPSPSPMRVTNGDPFAALDTKFNALGLDSDELSSRFPTLDQFSLLHDQGTKFDFDENSPEASRSSKAIGQKVAERLADEVFASPAKPPQQFPEADQAKMQLASPPLQSASAPPRSGEMSRASAIIASTPELQAISSPDQPVYQTPAPVSKPMMVSTGIQTNTPPPEKQSQFPTQRFPSADQQHRSASVPRAHETSSASQSRNATPSLPGTTIPRVPSFSSQHARHPSSSRPSLEGGRPSLDFLDSANRSANPSNSGRQRPASTYLESNLDYLREKERSSKPLLSPGLPTAKSSDRTPSPAQDLLGDGTTITSNVDYLRSMEDSDSKKRDKSSNHHHHHHSHSHGHKHGKRGSITSLSGTKNILAGKFGDVFKRFESNSSGPPPPRTPSPLKLLNRSELTPIAGSEATDGRSDDGEVLEETDDMTPEMRREIERRRLSQEEKRVAAAGAEYRRNLAHRGESGSGGGGTGGPGTASGGGSASWPTPLPKSIGGVSRAVSIQNKVQSLLDESSKPSVANRTASGYGHFTDTGAGAGASSTGETERPEIPRKPIGSTARVPSLSLGSRQQQQPHVGLGIGRTDPGEAQRRPPPPVGSKPETAARPVVASASGRPMAPPKPTHLNKNLTSGGRPPSPPKPSHFNKPLPPLRGPNASITPQQQLVAPDLPGQPALDMSAQERDEYLRDFAKRFPSLTSIEMVERDLTAEAAAADARSGR